MFKEEELKLIHEVLSQLQLKPGQGSVLIMIEGIMAKISNNLKIKAAMDANEAKKDDKKNAAANK